MANTKKKTPRTKFELLVAEAMDTLRRALAEKDADNIWISVWRGRADARFELRYEPTLPREVEGTINANGIVSLGGKP